MKFTEAFKGGDRWIRTTDSRIFSPMLYQLSYITSNGGTKEHNLNSLAKTIF